MTTPNNPPDEPRPDAPASEQAAASPSQQAAGPPPEQAAAPESPQPEPPAAPGPAEQPTGAWMPGSWQPGGWPPGYPPPGSPFAPVARAPRTPWVNPDRRVQVVVAAIVGALVFGGGGVLVGHALTSNGHDRDGVGRIQVGPKVRPPGFPGYRVPGPGRQRHNVPNAPTVTKPAPSGSATS